MKQELEQKLYEKYPKIFAQKDLPMSLTNMNWGCCVGDGWYSIINSLCYSIQNYIDNKQKKDPDFKQIEFVQVKEKFGQLRIYCNYSDEVVNACINFAEHISASICEDCGNPGKIRGANWLACRCNLCEADYQYKRNNP